MEDKAITENLDEIQEMAYTDVQIACDNAKRIMEMMDEGVEPESWNYSKITMAADYLTSVYTAMRAKGSETQSYDSYYEEASLTEVKGGKVVATENGYPIHDMGANFPYKDKRFLIRDPVLDIWQSSSATLTGAKKIAKDLSPANGRNLGKTTDHDDWSDEQKRRISSGEVRKAVMSRR